MSELRKFIWCASAALVATVLLSGAAVAGDFLGLPMYLDATVGESPAVNDSLQIVRTPATGDTVKFDLFVPGGCRQENIRIQYQV
jgi:hypothetical protein